MPSRAPWRFAYGIMISWRRVAKSRRAQALAGATVKCSRTVVGKQHSLLRGNDAAHARLAMRNERRLTPAADHPPRKQKQDRADGRRNKRSPEAKHRHLCDFRELGAHERTRDTDQDVGEDAVTHFNVASKAG